MSASVAERRSVARTLLDYLRRELAIKVDYLDSVYQETLRQRRRWRHRLDQVESAQPPGRRRQLRQGVDGFRPGRLRTTGGNQIEHGVLHPQLSLIHISEPTRPY